MPKQTINVKKLLLSDLRGGTITINYIEKPSGEYSGPVVEIMIQMKDSKETSKIQLPYEDVEDVIEALQEAQNISDKSEHFQPHAEMNFDTGGGE